MIEISPILPTYPVMKPTRIIPDRERQQDQQQTPDNQKKDETELSNEPPEQHVDEIV